MKKNKLKKSLSILFIAICLLVGGSFAYFTDQALSEASASAGSLKLIWNDVEVENESLNDSEIDFNWNKGIDNFNPGDQYAIDWSISNGGNKSMDVVQMVTVIVTNSEGEPILLDKLNSAFYLLSDEAKLPPDIIENVHVSVNDNIIVYEFDKITINGIDLDPNNPDDIHEVETNGLDGPVIFDYSLMFNPKATNEYQGCQVEITYSANALQHRNTQDIDWSDVEFEKNK